MSKKKNRSKVSSPKGGDKNSDTEKVVTLSEDEKTTSTSTKVSANEVKIKAHANGIRFTGPYRTELPGTLIEDLKTRDKEVIMDKKYLKFLVSGSYKTINK